MLTSIMGVAMMLCLTLLARGQTVKTISGPDTLCINSSAGYSVNSPTSNVTYQWTATLGTVQGTTTGVTSNVVWGSTPGTATISVNGYDQSNTLVETGSLNVELISIGLPSIYSNYRVACIKAYDNDTSGSGGEPVEDTLFFDDAYKCHKVCEGSLVEYGVNGSVGQYSWVVTGGTIQGSSISSKINVLWGSAGGGSVTVYEYVGQCTVKRTICIDIIEKPRAAFSVVPSVDTVIDCDTFNVCLDAKIAFKNLSFGSPNSRIVDYYWDFGDGTSSAQKVPPPHSYAGTGYFQVYLVVTNECGCVDSTCAWVNVYEDPGPNIYCQAVACEGDSVEYCTDAARCSNYNWQVVNGTIVTNNGNCITVLWDDIDGTDGFGYVSLDVNCPGLCTEPTTIKVPVVQKSPIITGPSKLCVGAQYKFSLPLWPGTEYNWGVLNTPSAIVNNLRKSNEVLLKFSSPGTYDVHVTWQNHITLCGGDTTFPVTVMGLDSIVGPNAGCKSGSNITFYNLATFFPTSWRMVAPDGSVDYNFGTQYPAIFSMTGTYTLYADDYCADPLTIQVSELTAIIDSVKGEDTVCRGKPYTYTAYSNTPGTVFSWFAIGGTIQGSGIGANTTVVWNGSLPGMIIVKKRSTTYPFCEGPEDTIIVHEATLDPYITGPDTVCSDSYLNYFSANYSVTGATYTWEVIPETAGNVVAGTYGPDVEFKANYFATPTPAKIAFTMKQCDSIRRDTFDFWIVPRPTPSITGDTEICSGNAACFTASYGAGTYDWSFGDNTSEYNGGNPICHTYWNADSFARTYWVKVTLSGGTQNCPPNGVAYWRVKVNPGPMIFLSSADTSIYCDGSSVNTTINSIITYNGSGSYEYEWFKQGVGSLGPPSSTASSYTAHAGGIYYVIVTDLVTGCKSKSSEWGITVLDCSPCPYTPIIDPPSTAFNCGSFTVQGQASLSPWNDYVNWDIQPKVGYVSSETKAPLQYDVTVVTAGVYTVSYSRRYDNGGGDTCIATSAVKVEVPLSVHPSGNILCDQATNSYTLELEDHSAFLPFYKNTGANPNITARTWTVSGPSGVFNSNNATFTLAGLTPGTYTCSLQVQLIDPNTSTALGTCSSVIYMVVPQWPTLTIDYDPSSICEGLPIDLWPVFSPTSTKTDMVDYYWDFGDNAYSKLDTTNRVYTYDNGVLLPPDTKLPSLTVKDRWGCIHTSNTGAIDIFPNNLGEGITGGTTVCNGPVMLNYVGAGAIRYLWSNSNVFTTSSSTSVNTSGSYFVTVEDANSCRYVTDPADVTVIDLQNTDIKGRVDYCEGESVFLTAFAGAGANLTYTWKRNGSPVGFNQPTLDDPGLAAGSYSYEVEIVYNDGVTSCTTTTAPVMVTINTPPPPPSIVSLNVLDCQRYELELQGSAPGGGTLYWSNGTTGPNNTIYSGGPYRLTYIDNNGCASYNDTLVPESPESYFGWFPDGCYEICEQQFPFTIFGPPYAFDLWQWDGFLSGTTVMGMFTPVDPFEVKGPDDIVLTLDNGLCAQNTDVMSVTMRGCDCPHIVVDYWFYCDPANPGGYYFDLTLDNPTAGDIDVTVGLGSGPVKPFKITLPPGNHIYNIYAVSMQGPPDTIEVSYRLSDGSTCYQRIEVDPSRYTYPCTGWPSQRPGADEVNNEDRSLLTDPKYHSGMVLYPNPATQMLNIHYNYGTEGSDRRIVVYDVMGRMVSDIAVSAQSDTYKLDVGNWAQGVYIVRMLDEGKALHTARVTVTH